VLAARLAAAQEHAEEPQTVEVEVVEESAVLEGDALRDAQKKLRAMANDCARQERSSGDSKAYFEAAKKAVGVESSKSMTETQALTMEQYLRDDMEGREPLI